MRRHTAKPRTQLHSLPLWSMRTPGYLVRCGSVLRWMRHMWYHKSCIDLCTAELDSIGKDNVVWLCCKCETINHSSLLFHAFELNLHNNYSILTDVNINSTISSIASPTAIPQPLTHSSPNTPRCTRLRCPRLDCPPAC